MKKQKNRQYKLIVTVALKKEVPKTWFLSHEIPVSTLEALQSGILNQQNDSYRNMLVVITGAGQEASEEAACWILDHLDPLFVFNIGTCGLTNHNYPLGKRIQPRFVANESGDILELDTRMPMPHSEKLIAVQTLLSVKKATFGKLPDSWKKYDAIDMECYSQAMIFSHKPIHFHCLKFSTDYSDHSALSSYNKNLDLFHQEIKKIFSFVDRKKDSKNVSVIVPVYNRQQTLQRAVDSVFNQTHPAEEIIVVDDGSNDGTKEILKSYQDNITSINLPQNSGVSRARNEGVKHAKTDFIAFLDSDDYWEKDKLKNQLEYIHRNPFYEIIQSEEIWIRNGKRVNPCKHHKKPEGWIWEESLERCLISPSSVLMKKTLLERYAYFNENLPASEDYDLWLKITRHHPAGLEPSFSVIKHGGHEDQLSRKHPAMDKFRVRTLIHLLEKESSLSFREKIIAVLTRKLEILIQGYEKRKKWKEAEMYRHILIRNKQEFGNVQRCPFNV